MEKGLFDIEKWKTSTAVEIQKTCPYKANMKLLLLVLESFRENLKLHESKTNKIDS